MQANNALEKKNKELAEMVERLQNKVDRLKGVDEELKEIKAKKTTLVKETITQGREIQRLQKLTDSLAETLNASSKRTNFFKARRLKRTLSWLNRSKIIRRICSIRKPTCS
jgi:septal ring factor EnvC (AmiA/AmiB activator)